MARMELMLERRAEKLEGKIWFLIWLMFQTYLGNIDSERQPCPNFSLRISLVYWLYF